MAIDSVNSYYSRFILHVVTQDSQSDVTNKLLATLNEWKRLIEERETESQDVEDHEMASTYQVLCLQFQKRLTALSLVSKTVMVLTDADQRIQAVAELIENADAIHVAMLLSAAWNVPMSDELPPAYKSVAVKGAGTTLMRQIYEFAKRRQKSRLQVAPLLTSERFYRDHLKMERGVLSGSYYFAIAPDSIPTTLQVPSGSLLA